MAGRMCALLAALAVTAVPLGAAAQQKPSLDFDFYRSRVEPVFLTKKEGHTRCVVCHADANNNFHLEKLSAGATAWTEEQSRRNFAMIAKLVNPGDPDTSLLTIHPLAPEGGGHSFHSGGRQFMSKDDPDFQILVQFVNGAK